MQNIESIDKEIRELRKNIEKYSTETQLKKKLNIFGDRFILLIFGSMIFSSFITMFMVFWNKNIAWIGNIILNWIFLIIIISMIYRILFYTFFRSINFKKRYSDILHQLYSTHDELLKNYEKMSSINDILNKISEIQKYIKNLQKYRKIWTYTSTKTGIFYMELYIRKEISFIQELMIDLRSDLSGNMREKQEVLTKAKSEVEKNLTGTPELLEVSEVQKLRLDRQIEQFEVLQKRLISL